MKNSENERFQIFIHFHTWSKNIRQKSADFRLHKIFEFIGDSFELNEPFL